MRNCGYRPSENRPALSLVFGAQAVEALLHLFHLALEVVVFAAASLGALLGLGRLARASTLAARERCEHREGALEHLHVPAHLLLDGAEPAHAERLRHLLAELLLLARERVDRDLEIARHQHLHAVAVKADELAQE